MQTLTLSVPTHFLVPMIFGDVDALDATDRRAFNRLLNELNDDLGHGKPVHVGTITDQPYFSRHHDASDYGVLACMCVDVDIIVHDGEV